MSNAPAKKTRKQIVKNRYIYDACPLCESKEMSVLQTANCSGHPLYNNIISPEMTWKKCGTCAHIFTDGYFTDEAFEAIFSKTNEHQTVGYDYERQRPVSAKMV